MSRWCRYNDTNGTFINGWSAADRVLMSRREERYMTELFPDAYPEYKRHSKMLIPFLL
jgi:protein-S-isoprenylcysteine O-methyltransferase Ste14